MSRVVPILFEDEHLLVVAKPAGLLVVDAPDRSGPTLVDLVSRQLGSPVYPVHRLDEDTTGVLALTRSTEVRAALEEMLRERRVERRYLALVARMPAPRAGRIESRLVEDAGGVMRSTPGRRAGKLAITNYRTIERRQPGALVECWLETGRRNQIRVHLADLGCPVVGDRKYGYRAGPKSAPCRRPLLHALSLSFVHPVTQRQVTVSVDAPESALRPGEGGVLED